MLALDQRLYVSIYLFTCAKFKRKKKNMCIECGFFFLKKKKVFQKTWHFGFSFYLLD